MADTDIAYLAGFLDGEGTFGVYRQYRSRSYRVILQCEQVIVAPIAELQARFGGYVDINGLTYASGRTRNRWRLLDQSAVRRALQMLIPFLKVKGDEARLCLDFLTNRRFSDTYKGRPRASDLDVAEQESFAEAIRELKYSAGRIA